MHALELLALLQVGEGAREDFVGEPEQLGRRGHAAGVERDLQVGRAAIDAPPSTASASTHDVLETERARRCASRPSTRARPRRPAVVARHEEQARCPASSPGCAATARRDDQQVGHVAVEHEGLARRRDASRRRRAWRCIAMRCRPVLVDCSSTASVAIRSPRASGGSQAAPAAPRCRPAQIARDGDDARRKERRRRQVRPISSITTPASTMPEPEPPWASGTSMPVKPISAKRSPQRAREAVGIARVAQLRAAARPGALSARKTARAVAQHGLFFGQHEGHAHS